MHLFLSRCSLRGWPHSTHRCLPPSMIGLDFIKNPPSIYCRTRSAPGEVTNRSARANRESSLGRAAHPLPRTSARCVRVLPCAPARGVPPSRCQLPRRAPRPRRSHSITCSVLHSKNPAQRCTVWTANVVRARPQGRIRSLRARVHRQRATGALLQWTSPGQTLSIVPVSRCVGFGIAGLHVTLRGAAHSSAST